MGKFLIFCRIQLKCCSWLYKRRWLTSWKFQYEKTSINKVIAKKPLTNLYEMNSRQFINFIPMVTKMLKMRIRGKGPGTVTLSPILVRSSLQWTGKYFSQWAGSAKSLISSSDSPREAMICHWYFWPPVFAFSLLWSQTEEQIRDPDKVHVFYC